VYSLAVNGTVGGLSPVQYVIKRIMGHKAIVITAGYIHISNEFLSTIKSPLDIRGIVQ